MHSLHDVGVPGFATLGQLATIGGELLSAIKRKFGADVVSINPTAMVNEVLCKLICHNLSCLIMEQETLGIVPVFWKEEPQEDDGNILRIS